MAAPAQTATAVVTLSAFAPTDAVRDVARMPARLFVIEGGARRVTS